MSANISFGVKTTRLAEGQRRLEARPRAAPPPATLAAVSDRAAALEAEAQAALWRRRTGEYHELMHEARKLYEAKRILWARRSPGRYLREQREAA